MGLRINALSLVLIFLLISLSSSGIAEGFSQHDHPMHGTYSLDKNQELDVRMNHRKLMFDSMLDYDDAGPNPKHDPRKKPPGGRP